MNTKRRKEGRKNELEQVKADDSDEGKVDQGRWQR